MATSFVTVVVVAMLACSFIAVSVSVSGSSCIFIFGDSLVDTGNNNYITTLARADIWYNGIDFANGFPTGRFCNGRTAPDYLSQIMKLSPPVPYLDPEANGTNLLGGVNFASGGSGILPSTGYKYIGRTPFDRQIEYFADIKAKLASMMDSSAQHFISEALFYINIGSYDYVSNYFLPDSKVSQLYSVGKYQQLLLSRFADQLKKLYEMGARKIFISNLGPLGCTPLMISLDNLDNGSCVGFANGIISDFNTGLENMIKNKLQNQFLDARFVLSDNYAVLREVINNPAAYGFKYANESCCGLGHLRAEFPCSPISGLCFHRADYVFWDAFHPTDALNSILATTQYAGSPEFVRPVNLKQLMNLS